MIVISQGKESEKSNCQNIFQERFGNCEKCLLLVRLDLGINMEPLLLTSPTAAAGPPPPALFLTYTCARDSKFGTHLGRFTQEFLSEIFLV